MKKQLQALLEERVAYLVGRGELRQTFDWLQSKIDATQIRNAKIVKVMATGKINGKMIDSNQTKVAYTVHWKYLIKQGKKIYMEEELEKRSAVFEADYLLHDYRVQIVTNNLDEERIKQDLFTEPMERISYHYDRQKAVQYAERWWNEFNPAYPQFEDDCSNYISQCLRAGGAPMWGNSNRNRGWWYSGKSWSYSWTVAHALQMYLQSSKGLKTKRMERANQLILGDIIAVDFDGDGRFNHSLIVTGFDGNGMPLVNAHTTNSRLRYWAYEDSTAYTPNIRYKFFHILDQ